MINAKIRKFSGRELGEKEKSFFLNSGVIPKIVDLESFLEFWSWYIQIEHTIRHKKVIFNLKLHLEISTWKLSWKFNLKEFDSHSDISIEHSSDRKIFSTDHRFQISSWFQNSNWFQVEWHLTDPAAMEGGIYPRIYYKRGGFWSADGRIYRSFLHHPIFPTKATLRFDCIYLPVTGDTFNLNSSW